jgi:peptidoglycan/LPS O-acetylase OafA/YrhL
LEIGKTLSMRLASKSTHIYLTKPIERTLTSNAHFIGLDGLRGIAAFAVFFFHGIGVLHVDYRCSAYLAVDFFFLLSGFVISYSYDRRILAGMTWTQFMKVRTVRLYPMLLVGTSLGGLVYSLPKLYNHQFSLSYFVIILIPSFLLFPVGLIFGAGAYPFDMPVWSLFFEFVANAFYGSRFGKLDKHSLTALAVVSATALIAIAIWCGPFMEIGWATPTSYLLGFIRVAYPFLAGVFLYRVAQLGTIPSVPIGLTGSLLALLLLLPITGRAYDLLLVLLVFPLLVAMGARARPSRLAASVCSVFGRLSYPLYLVHLPILVAFGSMSSKMHVGVSPILLLAAEAAVSVAIAIAILVAFDEPIRIWLNRRLKLHGLRRTQSALARRSDRGQIGR